MMYMNLNDIAILNIKSSDYRYIISGISQNDAINLQITYKNGLINFRVWEYWYRKKMNFCSRKSCIFKKDVDIEKVLVSKRISTGEKNYKYFIGF